MKDQKSTGKIQKSEKEPSVCESCGGRLERKSPYLYCCPSCGMEYYISANRNHKVSVRLSAGKMVLICAAIAIAVTAAAVLGYQYYTGRMVMSASRFSVIVRDFLMEAYEKPAAEISPEDLSGMKYLKIQWDKGYCFTYSYEDYYEYEDKGRYERTLKTITVKGNREDFSPTDVQYFTGLTRLELYTGAWENYILPEENVLRCIYCVDGLSKYGTPEFFDRVNPDTLEEVAILDAGELTDFVFMENLKGGKRFLLEKAAIDSGEAFNGFDELEELVLCYVEMEEEDAVTIMEQLLSLPSLKRLYVEGKAGWYISQEQWEEWQQRYKGRITLERV